MNGICVFHGPCYRKPAIHSVFHLDYKEDICDINYLKKNNLEVFSVTEQISLQKKIVKQKILSLRQ